MGKYRVYVDDNFHYQDKNYRILFDEYDSLDEAIRVCKEIVDKNCNSMKGKGKSFSQLYEQYTMFGDDPWIAGEGHISFSSWAYAKKRCKQLASSDPKKVAKRRVLGLFLAAIITAVLLYTAHFVYPQIYIVFFIAIIFLVLFFFLLHRKR